MRYSDPKKVLVIAYHYPPDAAVGARRTERFVKNLPQLGWHPHVLTVQTMYYRRLDKEHTAWIDYPCGLTRTRMIHNPGCVYIAAKHAIIRKSKNSLEKAGLKHQPKSKSWWRRVLLSLLLITDDKQGWLPFATITGLQIMRQQKFNCIYSSGPPWTTHLIALMLHTLTKTPWAADFRDPWIPALGKPPFSTSRLSDWIEEKLRQRVLNATNAIIVNTNRAELDLSTRYHGVSHKVTTITNGFDWNEMPVMEPEEKFHRPLVLLHTGNLYPERDPHAFLMAYESLIEDGTIKSGDIQLHFIGTNELDNQQTVEIMNRLIENGYLVRSGPSSHNECLKAMLRADGLLLLSLGSPAQIPAKLFEYLMVSKPILTIADPSGQGSMIVKETQTGIVADRSNIDDMRSSILKMMDIAANRDETFRPDKTKIAKYDFKQLTARLAAILDSISSGCIEGENRS